jgi:hypothetical protein
MLSLQFKNISKRKFLTQNAKTETKTPKRKRQNVSFGQLRYIDTQGMWM